MTDQIADAPQIIRMRHELRRRNLRVAASERLSPHMIRLTLQGADMHDFNSGAPDDHMKLILNAESDSPQMRDYTPRRFSTSELVVDVVDHPGGPAADWARAAAVGDAITIGGPRGSQRIEGAIDQWLLIGDETALPAIGRWIEEMPAATRVTSIVGVPDAADEQSLDTAADWTAHWLHRPLDQATDPAPYLAALGGMTLPPRTFVWIAAEAMVARAIRTHLLDKGHDKQWIKASGYWVAGQADASDKGIED
ncbi:siderophore-interacting protein [Pseudosulfitobacter sp. DSM 107133]|uniref:siderophore-interacting protein n=1 Tax=Pseudosulfitobacter sp. DSM 107133 TaxID=2883100 RepID=UPI000DF422E4|nr:siderophore-interacting protein [Pseudosulfitobacter sp. DSM 107133]UOA26297.1 NADPH-dependent ferric-chelate reductase [Pseudosulfitobacter sp. DSM 107133]